MGDAVRIADSSTIGLIRNSSLRLARKLDPIQQRRHLAEPVFDGFKSNNVRQMKRYDGRKVREPR